MNDKLTRALATTLLLAGAIGISLAAQPRDGWDQGERPQPLNIPATLGITEDALMPPLGEPGQGHPDLAVVAATLGITDDALISALGIPEGGGEPQQDGHQPPQIDFASVAETLGVTEEALFAALDLPEGEPQSNGPPSEEGRR